VGSTSLRQAASESVPPLPSSDIVAIAAAAIAAIRGASVLRKAANDQARFVRSWGAAVPVAVMRAIDDDAIEFSKGGSPYSSAEHAHEGLARCCMENSVAARGREGAARAARRGTWRLPSRAKDQAVFARCCGTHYVPSATIVLTAEAAMESSRVASAMQNVERPGGIRHALQLEIRNSR